MIFEPLEIAGALLVTPEPIPDERGSFARLFAADEFTAHGVTAEVAQISMAVNPKRGTLRGMHLQLPPHAETKLVRCTAGSAHDVLVDLRPTSETFLRWTAVTLDSSRRSAVSVPEGVAHGYLTLEDDTEMEYLISAAYDAGSAVGVRWDDPTVAVEWPFAPTVVGARDRAFPDVDRARLLADGLSALRPKEVHS